MLRTPAVTSGLFIRRFVASLLELILSYIAFCEIFHGAFSSQLRYHCQTTSSEHMIIRSYVRFLTAAFDVSLRERLRQIELVVSYGNISVCSCDLADGKCWAA